MAVGRISGPLLKANLLRNGVDLAFETDLLYLDVNNLRVGVKTNDPSHDLHVNGTTRTTTLEVTNQLDIGEITVTNNTISTTANQLTLNPTGLNPVVYQQKLVVDNLDIENNSITANSPNTDIELEATGTGEVKIFSNTRVNGNLHATGTITADGDIQIGDSNTDNIVFNADINSDIIPNINVQYDLGSTSKRWKELWSNDIQVANLDISNNFLLNGVDLTLRPGNIYYVSENGSDSRTGTHQNDPFLTVKHALTVASSGDTVYIYPGTYTEILPLTVPVGVTVKGSGIRSVTIQPTAGTISNDVFLLNGETTIEDLTITGFRYNSVANTGHAFRFATNLLVSSRSPYVRNVTVITTGSVTSSGDPRGFNAGDAGRGAYLDASVANALSKEAACLFHSATFITPGVDTITAINGVRIEWLNSFTYFANRGLVGLSGSTGFAGSGKTELRLNGVTGTFAPGQTLTYYSTFPTVLASGTISSVASDGKITLTGKVTGLQVAQERGGKLITANGNAKLSQSIKKFGTASLALDGTGDYASVAATSDFAFGLSSRTPKSITLTGDVAISSLQSKFGGSSILFDGTGDKITVDSSSDFAFGTGNFTAEAWIYRNSTSGSHCIFDFRTASAGNNGILLFTSNTLQYSVNGSVRISVAVTGTGSVWTHVALVRSAGTTTLYVNGSAVGTPYVDGYSYVTSTVTVGSYYNNTAYFNGYIDEVRISNSARYTGTFTPSTTAFTHDQNSVLLIHGNTNISDDGGVTAAGDLTIEGWVYRTTSGLYQLLFDMRTAATDVALTLAIDSSNQLYCFVNGSIVIQGASVVPLNTWAHVALTRSSTSLRVWLNGVQQGSTYVDNNNYVTKPLRIGADWSGLYGFAGYIDDVRLSKGISRYNTTFTVPISASANDQFTKLLCRFNGADNSTTFVDDVLLPQDVRSSGGATATEITLVDHSDFGVEVRSIASANVYGNFGAVGDGLGVIMYLIGHNMAYIGTGLRSDNDVTYVNQPNEVVESNGAHIYYSTVDHKGDFRVGDLFYVNQVTGEVTFTSVNFNIDSTQGLTFTNGSNVTYIDGNEIDTGNLRLSGNTLESIVGAINIASANDQINLLNNVSVNGNLDVVGNVTIGGNIIIGDQTTDTINFVAGIDSNLIPNITNTYDIGTTSLRWKDLYVNRTLVGGISVTGNQITTTTTNANLELVANGTGHVALEGFVVQDNTITTTANDLVLQPNGTGIVDVNSTKSIKVPVGTELERPATPQAGMIRFNTTLNRFEGYNGTNWVFLDGVSDLDGNTRITAELTPGANDDTIRFYSNGTVVADINPTRLNATKVVVDDIEIDGTTITNTAGGNLSIQAAGTGNVILENFQVSGNNITNTTNNAVTTLTSTGTGYVRIMGQGGFVVPSGIQAFRPTLPVTGMVRFDTQLGRLEVFDGTDWISVAGAATGVTKQEVEDLALQYAIALG